MRDANRPHPTTHPIVDEAGNQRRPAPAHRKTAAKLRQKERGARASATCSMDPPFPPSAKPIRGKRLNMFLPPDDPVGREGDFFIFLVNEVCVTLQYVDLLVACWRFEKSFG